MKTVVTGANGFLGSWLVQRLLQEGHSVKALVRKNSDLSELSNSNPDFVYGDVTDLNSLVSAFEGADIVYHLAGVIAYRKSDRELMDKVNVEGTKNVISALSTVSRPKLLHLSSVVAIGSSTTPVVLSEESPYTIGHLNLGYFETKRIAEQLVIQAAQNKKIDAVCVNPSTIYGFGDAKKSSRKNQLKVARGELKFFTSGGVNVVAVEDVIDGIQLAVQKGRPGQRYILASENLTIQKLFETIAVAAGVAAPQIKLPNFILHTLGALDTALRPLGLGSGVSSETAHTATMFHWFDSKKAQIELGFKPRPSYIAIENSVRWMKDHNLLK